ncbi:MAG: Fpg/Nei family DNA glycosylase [Candidatus Dormibacteraeota bacterium]|nr:Fpg/Nei family DNA glycosylase [Candidatus Dormibacteraeota bacterium]
MPELPEVESLSSALGERLRGARVAGVTLRSVAALKTYDPPLDALCGLAVRGGTRHGKFIDLQLPPLHLIVHLSRGGWIRLRDAATERAPVSLRGPLALSLGFEDGRGIDITEHGKDKRLAVYVVRDPREVPGIARLGPDALDAAFDVAALGTLLSGQHGTIKSVLADQRLIAGIGNAYSDEMLHVARLSPFRRADTLTAEEVATLHVAMREILEDALAEARAASPETLKSAKKLRMRVHGRTGEACPVCGDTVREVAFTTRSFQYCARCQTGGRVYADRRMSRLLK